jgi:hypothetical protein
MRRLQMSSRACASEAANACVELRRRADPILAPPLAHTTSVRSTTRATRCEARRTRVRHVCPQLRLAPASAPTQPTQNKTRASREPQRAAAVAAAEIPRAVPPRSLRRVRP